MAVNKPVNKKEEFQNEARTVIFGFGIVGLIIFGLVVALFIFRVVRPHSRISQATDSVSSFLKGTTGSSKYLLTATPNYF